MGPLCFIHLHLPSLSEILMLKLVMRNNFLSWIMPCCLNTKLVTLVLYGNLPTTTFYLTNLGLLSLPEHSGVVLEQTDQKTL